MQAKKLKSNKGNNLDGVLKIIPKVFKDERGFFYESWNKKVFDKISKTNFIQDNHSRSFKGVLRGLHYQINPYPQGKLVRCTLGRIFDVAVDLRINSNTYKEWVGIELNEINKLQLWIPKGFAHGFLTLSDIAEVQYKTTESWCKEYEKTIIWDDPNLKIEWPIHKLDGLNPILSNKDLNAATIKSAEKDGFIFL
tara:strand:+ start:4942 stop:5526 length:585 start_codon:yes stop_codon:yes gene_type:complete